MKEKMKQEIISLRTRFANTERTWRERCLDLWMKMYEMRNIFSCPNITGSPRSKCSGMKMEGSSSCNPKNEEDSPKKSWTKERKSLEHHLQGGESCSYIYEKRKKQQKKRVHTKLEESKEQKEALHEKDGQNRIRKGMEQSRRRDWTPTKGAQEALRTPGRSGEVHWGTHGNHT